MKPLKTILARAGLAAVIAGSALAATTAPASADVVCNRAGECWRVHSRYDNYPTTLGIIFHDDAWWDAQRRTRHNRYHWRNDRADDHGYYQRGRWHRF
ncbi:MAG: hypothetical protein JWP35_3397 [Caulobacter sp.]|nr:hypothetical protein [Caulobacter sp.]